MFPYCFLVAFCFLSMGQNSIIDNAPFVDNKIHLINNIKQENSENPTATYMPLNDNNEADDPESLAYDILLYYGIEPGQIDIEDDGFAMGFYSHYHAYYRSGNEFIKRYVWLGGAEVSIHGFYGYPW